MLTLGLVLTASPATAVVGHGEQGGGRLAPPTELLARDRVGDNGGAIGLSWREAESPDTRTDQPLRYSVERADNALGPFRILSGVPAGMHSYLDLEAESGVPFYYRVVAIAGSRRVESVVVGPIHSTPEWFNGRAWNLMLMLAVITGLLFWSLARARAGRVPLLRRLAGVDGIERAVSLAAETKRPLLYAMGTQDLNEIQTVAALSVLEEVAGQAAGSGVELYVPQTNALVLAVSDNVIQRSFEARGRAGVFPPDNNFYISGEQFGYAMGATGFISRESLAACIYLGSFYAEALTMAETGRTHGAYQVGGTAEVHQLPFFIATCDEVLIGEEMFAAKAQLSGDPVQLACLRVQDAGKLVAVGGIVLGTVAATIAALGGGSAAVAIRDGILSLFGGR